MLFADSSRREALIAAASRAGCGGHQVADVSAALLLISHTIPLAVGAWVLRARERLGRGRLSAGARRGVPEALESY